MFSNATEIHVNAPPHHSVMYGQNQYIYHNEKTKEFFGSYYAKENDIIYRQNLTNHHHNKLRAKAVMKTHSSSSGSGSSGVGSANVYVADKNDKSNTTSIDTKSTGITTISTAQYSGNGVFYVPCVCLCT